MDYRVERKFFVFLIFFSIGLLLTLFTAFFVFGRTEKMEWLVYEVGALILFPLAWMVITKSDINQKKNKKITGLLLNMALTVCILGFFVQNIRYYTFAQMIAVVLWSSFWFFVMSRKIKIPNKYRSSVMVLLMSGVILLEFLPKIQRYIDYHHISFYLGPVYEASLGKQIATEFPSQYGFLSIHFVRWLFDVLNINISFYNFYLFHTFLLILYFGAFFFGYRYVFKNSFTGIIFWIVTILLQTNLLQYSGLNIAPSTGPMRFGFGAIAILVLLYMRTGFSQKIILAMLGLIASLWSIETFLYIVPALIFVFFVQLYLAEKTFLIPVVKVITGAIIFFGILWRIFDFYSLNIFDFGQYAVAYKNSFGTIRIPIFGNYFLAIFILLLGVFTCVYGFLSKNIPKNILATLSFLSVHNLAIFSYFVSRSAYTNILNIGPFLLFELALVVKVLVPSPKNYNLPVSLFGCLFIFTCGSNLVSQPTMDRTSENTSIVLRGYRDLAEDYGLRPEKVLVVSKDFDTALIVENKLVNKLPLNPLLMTIILPDYRQKYIEPSFDKIENQTTLVYTHDAPEIFDILTEKFVLVDYATSSSLPKISLYNMIKK